MMLIFRKIQFNIYVLYIVLQCFMCKDINPELKPLLNKLNVDEKYHGLANEMYNHADKTLSEDKNPLKHIEGLNLSVRTLLNSIPEPGQLIGTEAEAMGKKILQYAKDEFVKNEIAECILKTKYNMSEEEISKFKRVYDDTKSCIEKLNVLFDCV